MPRTSACNSDLLRLLLRELLSEQQEESLARHLTDCPVCRRELERLAADEQDWSRISDMLRQTAPDFEPGSVVPRLGSQPLRESQPVCTDPDRDADAYTDFAVDFLNSSSAKGMLGRLGDVEISGIIGQGGMGIVLKGFQPELSRTVAVKVLAPHLASSGAARKRFAREAQAAAAILHPNVVPILTVNSGSRLPYLVMPYLACESLQQRLDREGSLPVVDVLRIGMQVARGLVAAHAQGLIHRDVKPANILLEKGVDRVMLTDFGLARAVDDASLTRSGIIAGTPQYMSPEQARGDGIDARSDLFSLASVLYAMCTGRPPFRAETSYGILRRVTDDEPRSIREINPEIPEWLERLIGRLHAKDRNQRPADAETVANWLEQGLAHVQHPTRVPLPEDVRTSRRRETFLPELFAPIGTWIRGMSKPSGNRSADDAMNAPVSRRDGWPSDAPRTGGKMLDRLMFGIVVTGIIILGVMAASLYTMLQPRGSHISGIRPTETRKDQLLPVASLPELPEPSRASVSRMTEQHSDIPLWDDPGHSEVNALLKEIQKIEWEVSHGWTLPTASDR